MEFSGCSRFSIVGGKTWHHVTGAPSIANSMAFTESPQHCYPTSVLQYLAYVITPQERVADSGSHEVFGW
jgi:hypothetical protein